MSSILNYRSFQIDPVPEVRETFARKLHKGLSKGIPHKCLPLDFMGYYALGGRETDRKLFQLIKTYIETDVNRRREYVKNVATGCTLCHYALNRFELNDKIKISVEKAMSQLPHILSDYMLVFAVPVLTHDPNFTNYDDPVQLKQLEKCLWLILEPLISNKEFFCFGFYKNLIDRMKHHKDSYKSDDDATNYVSIEWLQLIQ